MFSILRTAIIISILQIAYSNGSNENDLKYGITVETIEDPILYDTFIPLIYKFELPQWKSEDLKVKWPGGHSIQCDSSDSWYWTWAKQACPVVHHYNSLIHQILNNMTTIWKDDTFNKKSSKPFVISEPNQISPHFKNSRLSSKEWEDYLISLKRNSFGKPVVSNMSHFTSVDTNVYKKILSNFRQYSISAIAKDGSLTISSPLLYTQYAALTNSYTAIQSMEILNYYMERNRWAEAFATCKLLQIPSTLISPSVLLESLNEIEKQLYRGSRKIYSLSISKSELSAYFRLALTDCTFSTNNTFIVRILVPVTKHLRTSLIRITTIPFLKSGKNDKTELCELAVPEGTFMIHDLFGTLVMNSNYMHGEELYKIPDLSQWSIATPCLSAILNGNLEQVTSLCSMNCQVYYSKFSYFKKIGSDKYAIAGELHQDKMTETFVFLSPSCTKNPFEIVRGKSYGAIIITLPCDCVLAYRFYTLIASDPCNKTADATIEHIIPYLWPPTENAHETVQDDEGSNEIILEVSVINDIVNVTEASINDVSNSNDLEISENRTMNGTVEDGVQFLLDDKEFLPHITDNNNSVKVKELENTISNMYIQIFVLWACLVILMIVVLFMIVVLKNINTNCIKYQRSTSYVNTI